MVRAHLDVAVPGSGRGLSPTAAGGHVHRCCSPVRAVLDPARSAQPAADLTWGWDQAALAQSFSAMGLTPLVSTEWIADSGASFHTTPDAGILSSVRPTHPSCPSSIMVGYGSCLPVTAVGSAPGSFLLSNVLVAPQMVHNLLSIRQFTADNFCAGSPVVPRADPVSPAAPRAAPVPSPAPAWYAQPVQVYRRRSVPTPAPPPAPEDAYTRADGRP